MSDLATLPREIIISVRITAEERAALRELTQHSSKNVSALMREAIEFYSVHLRDKEQWHLDCTK